MSIAEIHPLSSGIRILYMHYPVGEVTHCALLIKAGTRDEPSGKDGLAHFIEHNLFKGTKSRKSYHILNRLEVVGGELNAYTTKEETCIHASVMHAHFERATELISDIFYNSIFPEKEIEKEKDVILDEIRSYQDTPYEQIFDDFEEQLFSGHALSHPILGTEQTLKDFKRADLINFIDSNYRNDEIIFAVSSNLSIDYILNISEKYFNLAKRKKKQTTIERTPFKKYKLKEVIQPKPLSQYHFITGTPAYSFHHPERMAMVLFNNLLGGQGMNSKLNLNIREKYGVTYMIESGYQAYSDSGIFSIYFATDTRNFKRTVNLVEKELQKLMEKGITARQTEQYKEQLIGQLTLSQENRLSVLLSVSKGVLYFNRIIHRAEIREKIHAVDHLKIQEIANKVLAPKNRSTLIYEPKLQ